MSHGSVSLGISHVAVSKGGGEVTRLTHSSLVRDSYDSRFTCSTFVKVMGLNTSLVLGFSRELQMSLT